MFCIPVDFWALPWLPHFYFCSFSLVHGKTLTQSHVRGAEVLSCKSRTKTCIHKQLHWQIKKGQINWPSGLWWSRYWLSQEISCNQHRSYSTFNVVYNWDYMLIEQLRGAAAELCRLNMLENGAKFHIFLTEWFTGNGRAMETEQPQFKKCNKALKQKYIFIFKNGHISYYSKYGTFSPLTWVYHLKSWFWVQIPLLMKTGAEGVTPHGESQGTTVAPSLWK